MKILILLLFLIGYLFITLEHRFRINKTASALLTAVSVWFVYVLSTENIDFVNQELLLHLGDISEILFFLMGAMVIIELVDAHNGFDVICGHVTQTKRRTLLWIVGFMAFFLSAILDNLTTTIVVLSILRKLVDDREERLIFAGLVVVAANAGGAWTPMGDITTTMLWIGGQISTFNIMLKLFLPSLCCLLVPLVFISYNMKGYLKRPVDTTPVSSVGSAEGRHQKTVLFLGLSLLLLVPIIKVATGLPPFIGVLFALGVLWLVIGIMDRKSKKTEEKNPYSIITALHRIDLSCILFFLGILLAVACLETAGVLSLASNWLSEHVQSQDFVIVLLGLLSSVLDNVPLVAAAQSIYPLVNFPIDSQLWELLAYAAGTGGSIFIIGSAAGIVAMGIEKIDFFWYVRKLSFLALLGYLTGVFVYFVEIKVFT